MSKFASDFRKRVRIGDAILSGGFDPISGVIQLGSLSRYSHVALVTGPDQLTEAYDHALTPDESDDGIFTLSMSEFLGRAGLRRVRVLRPIDIDQGRVREVAAYFCKHSPGFPTIGMACLALCGVSGPLLRIMPPAMKERSIMRQVMMATDGVRRMHCAETVSRIYIEAGLPIRFHRPRLRLHINRLNCMQPADNRVGLPTEPRVAGKGHWPNGTGLRKYRDQVGYAIRSAGETWSDRSKTDNPVDMIDLILPGDFDRADPFDHVVDFLRSPRGWREVAA